jgi:pimeloyl-ACP methyl ester carboxylesterase
VRSATTIASPLDFGVVAQRTRPLLKIRPLLRLGPVGLGWILRGMLPFLRMTHSEKVHIGVLRENLTGRELSELLVNVIEGFGAPGVLAQFGEWVEEGTFRSRDGTLDYGALTNLHCPLLAIAAERDLLTPPASVTPAIDRAPAAEKVYRLFGRISGDDRDFGHGDIVLSDAARRGCP